MKILLLIVFALCIISPFARAESSATPDTQAVPVMMERADFSALKLVVPKARVKDVVDPITMVIENANGETATVRLVSVWVPWDAPDTGGETVKAATDAMAKQFKGRMVKLYQPRNAKPDDLTTNLKHSLAMVERDDGLWAQGALVSLGLANVAPLPVFRAMDAQLFKLEAAARTNKLGLWGNPKWATLAASDSAFAKNQYRVVRGTVFSTFTKNNRIYVTFGPDGHKDLTIVIRAEDRLKFARAGVNVMGLNGQTIEARGFIQDLNGPVLIVTEPEVLKISVSE